MRSESEIRTEITTTILSHVIVMGAEGDGWVAGSNSIREPLTNAIINNDLAQINSILISLHAAILARIPGGGDYHFENVASLPHIANVLLQEQLPAAYVLLYLKTFVFLHIPVDRFDDPVTEDISHHLTEIGQGYRRFAMVNNQGANDIYVLASNLRQAIIDHALHPTLHSPDKEIILGILSDHMIKPYLIETPEKSRPRRT